MTTETKQEINIDEILIHYIEVFGISVQYLGRSASGPLFKATARFPSRSVTGVYADVVSEGSEFVPTVRRAVDQLKKLSADYE